MLEKLIESGQKPGIVITETDKPRGRGLKLASPPVKEWALAHNISILQPEKLDNSFISELKALNLELVIVASYGKIIPKKILDLPQKGSLNVHPSLLPKYRGPSPIQTAILEGETENGVTIMLMDEKMDHGPIVAQEKIQMNGTESFSELEKKMSQIGGELLAKTIPLWITGKMKTKTQNDHSATYTKKITKKDGLIDLAEKPTANFRKYLALKDSVGIHFLAETKKGPIKVKITEAHLTNGEFKPQIVVPENKRPMSYTDFLRGING